MTAETLDSILAVLRKHNVMSANLEVGSQRIAVTMGPELPAGGTADPEPGAWKTQVSDPTDPDPLGLGTLDAPMAFDDDEVQP
jgi:hypothetical protein